MIDEPIYIKLLYLFVTVTLMVSLYFLFYQQPLLLDEKLHFSQIKHFIAHGGFESKAATMTPGYHKTLAFIATSLNEKSIQSLRLFSTILVFITLITTAFLIKVVQPSSWLVKSLQLLLLPILLPFYPLLYTDIVSLLIPILAILSYFKKQFFLAGCLMSLSLLFRQTHLFWLLMLFAMIYVDQNQYKLSVNRLAQHLKNNWSFLIGIFLFSAFVFINKGVAAGNMKSSHQLTEPSFNNLFFMLLLLFIVFCPLMLMQSKAILNSIKQYRWRETLLLFIAYILFFRISHIWNLNTHDIPLLRNVLLEKIFSNYFIVTACFIPILVSIHYIRISQFQIKGGLIIIVSIIVSLMPILLIEPRYYIFPFFLFILLLKPVQEWQEWILIPWFSVISAFIVWGHRHQYFFL